MCAARDSKKSVTRRAFALHAPDFFEASKEGGPGSPRATKQGTKVPKFWSSSPAFRFLLFGPGMVRSTFGTRRDKEKKFVPFGFASGHCALVPLSRSLLALRKGHIASACSLCCAADVGHLWPHVGLTRSSAPFGGLEAPLSTFAPDATEFSGGLSQRILKQFENTEKNSDSKSKISSLKTESLSL